MLAVAKSCPSPLGRPGRYSLTPKQQRIYRAIVHHFDTHRKMPTVRELSTACNQGVDRILDGLDALEERAWIYRRMAVGRMENRGIRFVEPVLRHLKPVEFEGLGWIGTEVKKVVEKTRP